MNTSLCDDDPHERRALARFAAVQAVVQARQNGLSLSRALQAASEQQWDGRLFSPGTIEEWYYLYKDGKFAALRNRPRSDRGRNKALDPAALEVLLKLRREHPGLTVKALYEELLRQGVLESADCSVSTLQRRLTAAGLDRQSMRAGSGLDAGPTKAFELPLPNLLWMADCMYGPTLRGEDGHMQRTFLFALIDDCSRMCPHGQFYPQERLECFLDTLRQAVQSRGVPDKLYTDNGAAFRSQHLGIVCANLDVRLIHCKPYHAWSKGKIERFFRTVQTQFQPALAFEKVHSIDALNLAFWRWLESGYHQRPHGGLSGESPAARFARLGQNLRLLPKALDVDRLFLMRLKRRVRKDATFSLGGRYWEVPAHLRGQIITIAFDPVNYVRVEIMMGDRVVGRAAICDKHRNAKLSSSNDYDREPF